VTCNDILYTETLVMTPKPIISSLMTTFPSSLMRSLLREFGFEAVTAESGREAIDAVRTRRPSAALIDKNMPGMTGAELIRALRNEPDFDGLPILILSGEQVTSSELKASGADGAVLKRSTSRR